MVDLAKMVKTKRLGLKNTSELELSDVLNVKGVVKEDKGKHYHKSNSTCWYNSLS